MPPAQPPDLRLPLEVATERLVLRRWCHDDLEALAGLFAQPEFWRYPFGGPLDAAAAGRFVEGSLSHWAKHGFGRYAVVLPGSGRLIGYVGLQYAAWFPEMSGEVEIGWRIDTAEWGNGFATEGARVTLRQGFEVLGLSRVIAVWEPANVASGRIADKLGMSLIKSTQDPRGLDIEVMRIEREEWLRPGT